MVDIQYTTVHHVIKGAVAHIVSHAPTSRIFTEVAATFASIIDTYYVLRKTVYNIYMPLCSYTTGRNSVLTWCQIILLEEIVLYDIVYNYLNIQLKYLI